MEESRLDRVTRTITRTLRRFPAAMAAAAVGVIAVLLETRDERWMITAILAVPVLIVSALVSERIERARAIRIGIAIVPLPLLVLYFASLPLEPFDAVTGIQYTLLMSGSLLMILAAPFVPSGTVLSFHRFATGFVLRALLTIAFTLLLFGGLALALGALDKLFGVIVDSSVYGKLFAVLTGFVALPFLLSGIPVDLEATESSVPAPLRVLTQYVLLPILIVYAAILYAYGFQQLIAWEWSEGWVARLVIGFAGSGLLTFAILWPLRDVSGNRWIRLFAQWFALLLPPLAALLFAAVFKRVQEYGLTESRYYGLTLAVWLTLVAIYFLLSRNDDIRMVTLSLAVIALGTAYGPWGAVSVSVSSQIARLESTLTADGVLVDGRFVPRPPPAPTSEHEYYSIVSYLAERRALDNLRSWFPGSPDTVTASDVFIAIGLERPSNVLDAVSPATSSRTVELHTEYPRVIDISGYDYYARFDSDVPTVTLGDSEFVLRYHSGTLMLYRRSMVMASADVVGKMREVIARNWLNTPATDGMSDLIVDNQHDMTVDAMDDRTHASMRVVIERATIHITGTQTTVDRFDGYVLVRRGD